MRRGDELGAVEHYKYRLRHGGTVAKPTLDTDLKNNKVVGHEGRHRSRAAMEEGLKKIPTKLLNNRFDDENNKKRDLKGLKYEQDLTESSKELPKTSGKDTRHPMLGRKKSWESWLEKKNRTINDDFPKGNPPIKKKPTMFPRIIREFPDEKEDPMVYDNKTASWEDWLEKNNAIETSHKEDEKKHEWDGKFSSSTIRDDAKDEKAQSEEESLEELTDGKLEEIEKLKSWEAWLEKGRWDEPKSTATDTHLKEESGRDTRVEVNELNAEIGQEATNERLDEAGRTGMFKPTDTPNFTSKKPKYVKGVEQTGDDISQSKEHLNIDIAHAAKSWTIWLEKMQGAGDARFGNQHLTGLDQEPVNNEEDEANILPEKEEKTDDKREKHEETDDKPYKGLKAEKK